MKVTEADKRNIYEKFSHLPEQFIKSIQFSKVKLVFNALVFDDAGNLWAIRGSKNNDLIADVYNEDGHFISEVRLP